MAAAQLDENLQQRAALEQGLQRAVSQLERRLGAAEAGVEAIELRVGDAVDSRLAEIILLLNEQSRHSGGGGGPAVSSSSPSVVSLSAPRTSSPGTRLPPTNSPPLRPQQPPAAAVSAVGPVPPPLPGVGDKRMAILRHSVDGDGEGEDGMADQ